MYKRYLDKGKFAAPRWLVYPQLSAWTIGWRMGYGEDYALNEPYPTREFMELFPQPQNWLFDPRRLNLDFVPLIGYLWRDDGKPKYSKVTDNCIVVNDFITLKQEKEFINDIFTFESIEHALLLSKYMSFGKCGRDESLDNLRNGFELTSEELNVWEFFKYTVVLNASYYKFMQDSDLKEKLLATGDNCLVYESCDEWGGDENLFGFALMELRDELRRLYENEDLIDWEYTEYLKYKDPYENPRPRNPEDKQSPEYRIFEDTLYSSSKYVRDVNLDEKFASKYEAGQFITEKGFVEASSKIGGMITTHRYLIVSKYMADFSHHDEFSNWGLHVAKNNSIFKVLDIYEFMGKTKIILLQLPEGFESVFENSISIEKEFVAECRREFENTLKLNPIEELTSEDWLERCSFPLGMSDEGEFF
jgi:hypothetical protein